MYDYQYKYLHNHHYTVWNVRTRKSLSARIVYQLNKGEKFTVSKIEDGWVYLPDKKGWSKHTFEGRTLLKRVVRNDVWLCG